MCMDEKQAVAAMAQRLGLPPDVVPGQSLVELAGKRRLVVENHCGIRSYTSEHICLGLPDGMLEISGKGLTVSNMTKRLVMISGIITGLDFCWRNGK